MQVNGLARPPEGAIGLLKARGESYVSMSKRTFRGEAKKMLERIGN